MKVLGITIQSKKGEVLISVAACNYSIQKIREVSADVYAQVIEVSKQGKKVQRVMTIDSWMTCSCAVMGELLVYVFSQSLAMLGQDIAQKVGDSLGGLSARVETIKKKYLEFTLAIEACIYSSIVVPKQLLFRPNPGQMIQCRLPAHLQLLNKWVDCAQDTYIAVAAASLSINMNKRRIQKNQQRKFIQDLLRNQPLLVPEVDENNEDQEGESIKSKVADQKIIIQLRAAAQRQAFKLPRKASQRGVSKPKLTQKNVDYSIFMKTYQQPNNQLNESQNKSKLQFQQQRQVGLQQNRLFQEQQQSSSQGGKQINSKSYYGNSLVQQQQQLKNGEDKRHKGNNLNQVALIRSDGEDSSNDEEDELDLVLDSDDSDEVISTKQPKIPNKQKPPLPQANNQMFQRNQATNPSSNPSQLASPSGYGISLTERLQVLLKDGKFQRVTCDGFISIFGDFKDDVTLIDLIGSNWSSNMSKHRGNVAADALPSRCSPQGTAYKIQVAKRRLSSTKIIDILLNSQILNTKMLIGQNSGASPSSTLLPLLFQYKISTSGNAVANFAFQYIVNAKWPFPLREVEFQIYLQDSVRFSTSNPSPKPFSFLNNILIWKAPIPIKPSAKGVLYLQLAQLNMNPTNAIKYIRILFNSPSPIPQFSANMTILQPSRQTFQATKSMLAEYRIMPNSIS